MKSKLFKLAIIGVILFFFVLYLHQNWQQVRAHRWTFNYFYLLISLGLLGIYFSLLVFAWRFLLSRLTVPFGFRKTFQVWFYSQAGKYLPGGFWGIVGRLYLCEQAGIKRTVAATSVFFETILLVLSGLLVSTSLLFSNFSFKIFQSYLVYLLLIPLVFLLINPTIIQKSSKFLLRRFRESTVEVSLNYRDMFCVLFIYLMAWFVYGLGNFFVVKSVTSFSIQYLPALIGIFSLSWVVGFVSFLTPGGLGAREATLSALLSIYMPISVAIIVSLLARLCWTIVELSGIIIFSPVSLRRLEKLKIKKWQGEK